MPAIRNSSFALIWGAGGFIGGHPSTALKTGLVKKLKREGYWVCGVDIKEHEFAPTAADEFLLLDLREPKNCEAALSLENGTFDEVYQLAADMGEMGPAAICRKVAEAEDDGTIEVWGDGTAIRSYTCVSDMVDGTRINADYMDAHR